MYYLNMLHVKTSNPLYTIRYNYWALEIIKLSRFRMIDINFGYYKTKEINSHYLGMLCYHILSTQ